MKKMYGPKTSEYSEIVMNEFRSCMPFGDKDAEKELGQSIINTILDIDGETKISNSPSRKDKFIANKLFRPMGEILKSVEAIENISVYIRSFPHKRHNISKLSYLLYHVENYLNEIYILKCRLISYLNIVKKAYAGAGNAEKTLEPLYEAITHVFQGYVNLRGTHVHEARFSDKDFDKISTMELLSRSKDEMGNFFNILYKQEYKKIRAKWCKKIESDIKSINSFLELYFDILKLIIYKDEQLIIPTNYR
jgi:hypothetical protein